MNHGLSAAFVRDTAFDTFWYQLVRCTAALEIELVLEVAIAAAASHRADRAHAAILLVAAALEQDQLTRAFVGAGEEIPGHHAARAARERFDDVTRVADAAVGDDRNTA